MRLQHIHLQQYLRNAALVESSRAVPVDVEPPPPDPVEPKIDLREHQRQEKEHLNELVLHLTEAVQELEQRRSQSLAELRMAAVELAMLVASRIVYQQIKKDDFPIEQLVQEMMDRLSTNESIQIRLNPGDLSLFHQRVKELPSSFDLSCVSFEPDATLQRGECHAHAADFGLVSTIDQSLRELRQELLQELDDAQVERRKTQTSDHSLQRFPNRRETA